MDRLKMTDYEIFLLLSKYLETNNYIIVKDACREDNYIYECVYYNNHLKLSISYPLNIYNNIKEYDINEYSQTFRSNLINKLKSLNLDVIDCWND